MGSANMDLVVRAARLPAAGETVLGEDLLRVPGGKGANQAVAAARLGAAVRFVGNVGDDSFGTELRAGLDAEGIDTRHLDIVARASGVALIVVDRRGENLIAVGSGANSAVSVGQVERALSGLGADDVVLLQLEIPLAAVVQACQSARQAGARVVLNAAPATDDARLSDLLRLVAVLIVNEGEARALRQDNVPSAAASAASPASPATTATPDALDEHWPGQLGGAGPATAATSATGAAAATGATGSTAEASATDATDAPGATAASVLRQRGPDTVIVTLGGDGLVMATASGMTRLPAQQVKVVDTTAAGDAFCGAFAAALLDGRSPEDAAASANRAAALATTRLGAQSSLPTAAELAAFAS